MIDINKIIDEILLEHSQKYPIPSLEEREQVENMIECCYKLGYGEYAGIIEEFFITEAEPNIKSKSATSAKISKNVSSPKAGDGKEGESKEFPGKYHLGAGFYSSKQGGEAEFKNDGGNLRPVTPQEKEKLKGSKGGGAGAGGGKLATQTPAGVQPKSATPAKLDRDIPQTPAGVQPKSATPAKLSKDIPNDKWGDNPQEPDWMKGGDPTWGGAANQNSTWGDNPQEPDWAKGPAMWDKKVPPRVELPNMVRPKTGAPTDAPPPVGTKVGGAVPPPPPPPPPPPKVELPYKAKIQNWAKKEKEFFDKGQDKPGSETRRTFAQALKDKVKGAAQAIKHGFQHEVHTFKTAAKAVGKVFSEPGGFRSLDKEEKKALVSVGIKVASTALFAAAGGGLAHGAAAFAKHVAVELVPHAVAETIVLGVGRASLFASSDGNDERLLSDFMDAVADRLENMEITPEMMDKMVDSFNAKNPTDTQSENISLDEILLSYLIKEESEGESTQFPGKFHLGGGFYSSKQGGEAQFKNDSGSLRPITPEEKEEFEGGNAGDTDQNALMKTAEEELAKKEKEYEEENPIDPKTDFDKILSDPSATAQDIAKAKAFKRKNDILKQKQKDDPEYQSELKNNVTEKNEEIAKELSSQKDSEGNMLDAETTENGSLLIGVEHGEGNESTKNTIEKIKSLPKDAKVMFVGEGGVGVDDDGKIDFVGEQAELRDACLEHFDNAREESWDENSDVRNSDSPIFDEIAKSFGGDKEKAMASVWTNMVGQGDDLDADDYLTEETKEWIKGEARKGGSKEFDGDVDWNNLTLEQKEDLYQLNYRDDQNYGETDLSKGQKAYNDYRQQELDRKIKEAEEKGYTVIATMGNSHVGMWRERNKKKTDSFKPQSLRNLQKELPEADKEVFNKESDLDKIPSDKKEEISMKIDELADKASKGEDFNLCQITVPGTNLYCDDNQGIPREEMPQFKGKPLPGTPAEDLPKDSKGEVDTEPLFKKMLKEKGIKTVETELPSDKLKATQSELVGSKVAGMTKALEEDPQNPGITAPIYVSRDGFVIDGHHRWAAVTSAAIKAGKPANMKVIVVDMDIKDAIPMCNQFAEEQGIAAKKADANDGEQPKPKEPNKKEGGVIYPLGGGYYSDTKGGTAQYIKAESVVNKIFIEENIKFINLLFEDNLTMQTPSGKEVIVKAIDVKDQPEANKEVEKAKEEAPNVDVATARKNLQISDAVIESRIKEASKHIDSSEADEETKQILKDTAAKMLKGEDVDPANLEIAKKWISVRAGGGNDVGMYIAQKEGEFSDDKFRKKIIMKLPEKLENMDDKSDEWNDTMMNKYGLTITTQTGAYVNKKDWTANKTNKARKTEKIEASEDGNSVTLGGVTRTKRPVPDKKTLVEQKNLAEQFIKQGYSEEEANKSATQVIASIKRGNKMLDKLAQKGEIEVVDFGPTDTDENRRSTLKNTVDKTKKSILKSLKKYSGLSEEQILEKYADLFNSLDEVEKSAPINNPNWDSMSSEEKEAASKEYLDKTLAVLQNIRRDKDIASGGPDIAEVLVFMNEVGKGNQAFLPSSSNFPTVDIISFNEQKNPPENATPEELAEFYANEYSANSISFIDSDAESIKVGKGGSSAGPSKVDESEFNDEATQEALNSVMYGVHQSVMGDYPPSKESIDKAEDEYKKARVQLIKVLVSKGNTPEEAERIVSEMEKKATEGGGKKSPYMQMKDSYQKSLDPEEMDAEFDRGLKIYAMTGLLLEKTFNEDVKSNNFGNVRFIEKGKGKTSTISMEVLDGVNEKCCVKFNANPGEMKIKGEAGGKRKAGINVMFATWIVKCEK